ncbi:MAG: hypothetical protein HC789_00700 [Microcoleus sp. CSU_2_2]|nr:hypothetical protein [Microcoleus sp. SU_5_3]NJS08983.1 hypothetical protein [Microcoleus sp. CSU_2_2]
MPVCKLAKFILCWELVQKCDQVIQRGRLSSIDCQGRSMWELFGNCGGWDSVILLSLRLLNFYKVIV